MQQKIDNIQQTSPNCFVSKSYAKSGEEIFLTMELISEENQKHIRQFVQTSMTFTNGSIVSLQI